MEAFLYPQEDLNPYRIVRSDKFFQLNYGDNYNLNLKTRLYSSKADFKFLTHSR